MRDLIFIAGAPGSGKTTICDLLYRELASPYIDFGDLRNFHLDREWSNAGEREEQMAFENLVHILKNYIRYGYPNVIVNDLQDFRVLQIPELFSENDYIIASLVVENDDELAKRIDRRNGGFRDVEHALQWNEQVKTRSLLANEYRVDNSNCKPEQTFKRILKIVNANKIVS